MLLGTAPLILSEKVEPVCTIYAKDNPDGLIEYVATAPHAGVFVIGKETRNGSSIPILTIELAGIPASKEIVET